MGYFYWPYNLARRPYLSWISFPISLVALLLVLVFPHTVVAANYYIDATGGNDSNSGTSTDQAWQTITKVNSQNFSSGDNIYFKRGETFSDARWDFPSSIANNLTFDAYGSGAKPIITSTFGTRIDAGTGHNIRNLELRATGSGPTIHIRVSSVTLAYVDAVGNATQNNGAIMIGSNAADVSDITISHCTATGSNYYGLHTYDTTYAIRNVVVEYGTFYNNGTGELLGFHGIYFGTGTKNATARYNELYGNSGSGIKSNSSMSSADDRNYIYGNYSHDNKNYGIYLGGANDWVDVYNNIFVNNTTGSNAGYSAYMHYGAVVNMYNNTLVNGGAAGIHWNDVGAVGSVFRNNIVIQDSEVVGAAKNPLSIIGDGTAISSNNTFDYNLYYYNGAAIAKTGQPSTLSLAQWQASAGNPDQHSISTDSIFVANYTNLRLKRTSPAINAGTNTSLVTDYSGNSRPQGGSYDLGAYEYVPLTVTIDQAAGQLDPSSDSSIDFSINFSESVSGFDPTDLTIGGTAGPTTATITGSGTTYNVSITGMQNEGTVTLSVAADLLSGSTSNTNDASIASDNSVTYQILSSPSPSSTPVSSSLPSQQSSSSPASTSDNSTPACQDQSPGFVASWLYGAIPQQTGEILLFFTPAELPVTKYVLAYGTESDNYLYGIPDLYLNSREPMTYLVRSLSPGTTYYFRIRSDNGCMTGPWSNEISVTTGHSTQPNLLRVAQSQLTPLAHISSDDQTEINQITSSTEQPQYYQLRIRVTDVEGAAISGVLVTLHSREQQRTTDVDGVVVFEGVEPGSHQLMISYGSYQTEHALNLTGQVAGFALDLKIDPPITTPSHTVRNKILAIVFTTILVLVLIFYKYKKLNDLPTSLFDHSSS